jgi:hypothetical protein
MIEGSYGIIIHPNIRSQGIYNALGGIIHSQYNLMRPDPPLL